MAFFGMMYGGRVKIRFCCVAISPKNTPKLLKNINNSVWPQETKSNIEVAQCLCFFLFLLG